MEDSEYTPVHDVDERLLEPCTYLSQLPGKNVRGMLLSAFNKWLNARPEDVVLVAEVINDLHTASLLIDDIEDGADVRRGAAAAHGIFGMPLTFNAANYSMCLALEKVQGWGNPVAMKVLIAELLCLHRGQGRDIMAREKRTLPTFDEYESMVLDKTGGLFRMAIGMLQSFGNCGKSFLRLVNSLAYYFQVRDDYMSVRRDLMENPYSNYCIIHWIHVDGGANKRDWLKCTCEDDVNQVMAELSRSGSLRSTAEKLDGLRTAVLNLIDEHGGNGDLKNIINRLHETGVRVEVENE
eukprot:g441.t1